ncbi:MAG: GNAT family N-acetyltransferase [Cellulomonadaceae bacterium]|nr:GNAT family N-acetyltransferase [Cellulomonadaceae bacterium]
MDEFRLSDGAVLLTPPTDADLDDITRACQDPDIAAWVTVPSPYDRAHAEFFVRTVVADGWAGGHELTWAIREAQDPEGALVGMIGLNGLADGSAELGFWMAPWARREGFVGRAVALVLDAALSPGRLGLERVSWSAFVGNWPSRRVAWRAGFRVEGTIRRHLVHRGTRRDVWLGTILAGDPRRPVDTWPHDAPADGSASPVR